VGSVNRGIEPPDGKGPAVGSDSRTVSVRAVPGETLTSYAPVNSWKIDTNSCFYT